MSRLVQTARAVATRSFDWDRFVAEQCAARDQHVARLTATEARNNRYGIMLDNIAAGFLAGADEGCA